MLARLISNGLSRARIDFQEALRGLRSGGGTTVLAFVLLTLAMAAGTVTFSVVEGVALRPLPYASPEQLVGISTLGRTPGMLSPVSPQDYFSWLEGTWAFESLAASRPNSPLRLEINGVAETLIATRVTANLFDVLGVRPAAGRLFSQEHERPGASASVVLSHQLWARRFGADAGVIGRRLDFGQDKREVVGVLPAGVWYPITVGPPSDLYIPYVATASERSNGRALSMSVVGRLRPGVSVEQARAEVGRASVSAVVLPLHNQVVGSTKTWLLLMLAAVGFVLIIACVNVASLLLVRATTRAREFALREALGASRRRLAVGLLLEGLILAVAASAAGIVASIWGVGIARSSLPPGLLARVPAVSVDGRVLAVSIAAAVLCGLLFASAPAWLTARSDLVGLMKGGGPVIGERRGDRSLAAFLVAEIAFVCVLLVATTLVVTSFVLVATADLGFNRENVMTIGYQQSFANVSEAHRPAAAVALRADLLDRAKSVPGVTNVAIAANGPVPLSGGGVRYSITIPGVGETTGDNMLETRLVTPDYFDVMGMQLVRGRMFQPADRAGAPLVMLINDIAARRFFPDRDPIGQVVIFRGPTTIIGVLRGVHYSGPEAEVRPEMYIPADQEAFQGVTESGFLVVRTYRDARGLAAAVRDAIKPALAGREANQPQFVDDFFRRLTAGRRFNASLMASFGIIAVVIGAIGVYGTMAFLVAQQGRSIGLRMALGASQLHVMRSVLGDALRRVVLGVGIGLAGAWAASNAFASFVFGIRPTDANVYVAVGSFLAIVGFVAALVPALRAARIDPVAALRRE
jgi:putative ABC transport system permease protein